MKRPDDDLKKVGSGYTMSLANLGLGLIILVVFVLSVIYRENRITTIITLAFALAYIGIGIWGIADRRSKK